MKPLKDVRVLDLSKVFAGPLCGQYLGDLGADVIKVEPVEVGDDTRTWSPLRNGQSATFLAMNRNKRSLAVDLKSDEGREIVHALVADMDIVIQSFGAGTAAKLGVDHATLSGLNPRLIYCEISGFGRTGPMGNHPGYDVMLQAFSGMISTMGQPDGPFARASFSPVDLATGMLGVGGILAALIERSRTGKGCLVELSLLDSAMSLMSYLAQSYWVSGRPPERMGTAHPSLAPYQAFAASDGSLLIGAGNDAQWRRLCDLLGTIELKDDPRFATNAARVENFEQTVEIVQRHIGSRDVAHWLGALTAAGIPCSPIQTLDQALAHPQLASRGLVLESRHPVLGALPQIGFPVAFDGEARAGVRPPPLHGEHTMEVLSDLGFSVERIADLQTRHVIRG